MTSRRLHELNDGFEKLERGERVEDTHGHGSTIFENLIKSARENGKDPVEWIDEQ
jgi:hypothetical protein